MAITKKVLGQSAPSATVLTDAYTVPGATSATVSTLTACNHHNSTADTIRISIAVAGAANTDEQYIVGGDTSGGLSVIANDTFAMTIGITLAATDVVRVYSTNGTTSFNIFGVEES
jgi:hypothetical protein